MARGKRTATVPADETKAAKFRRLANMRVKKVLAGIDQLGRLGTAAYERSDDQVEKLHTAITDAAKEMRGRLLAGGRKPGGQADLL